MYTLFGFPTQNSKKVLYVLEELGVKYDYKYLNLMEGENRTEEFLKINPFGKAPTLQHDGKSLFESGAICRYIANVEGSELYPADKMKRAIVDQWLDYFTCHLGRWLNTLYFENVLKKNFSSNGPNEKSCAEALKFSEQQFKIIESHLSQNKFLAGEKLSIADLCAFAYVEQTHEVNVSLEEYPNLSKWAKSLDSSESIVKARKVIS